MKHSIRIGVAIAFAAIVGWFAFQKVPDPLPEISRAEFLTEIRTGHVHKIVVEDQEMILGESTTRGPFRSPYKKDADANLLAELHSLGIEVVFETSPIGLI